MILHRSGLTLALMLVAVVLVGCGAVHRSAAPFVKSAGLEAGGYPVLGIGPAGTTLRFIPSAAFGYGLVFHNRSRERVMLVDARVVEPPGTLIHQTGTSLRLWNPPPCSGGRSCPALGFLRGRYGPRKPTPLTLRPRDGVAVQLDFRLGSCADVATASAAMPTRLDLIYRVGNSKLREQTLRLGSARPQLRMPKPADCAPRPRSQIAVDGPFATGSDWTIPGSAGDTCTRDSHGRVVFVSRLYQAPNKPTVSVRIVLAQFKGLGLYRTLPQAATDAGPAQVSAIVGIGIHGRRPFLGQASVVTATSSTPTTLGGRFHATILGPKQTPFRAYGAWRCTVS